MNKMYFGLLIGRVGSVKGAGSAGSAGRASPSRRFRNLGHRYLVWRKWLVLLVLAMSAGLSWLAMGQDNPTPPNIRAVQLSADPITQATQDKPTMTIALGASFTSAGAQYSDPAWSDSESLTRVEGTEDSVFRGSFDASYSNATEYLGYFDAASCYRYIDAPTDADVAERVKRFQRVGAASQRTCTVANGNDGFSGNYLNWVSMSSLDIVRLALTGGHRAVDTRNLTVLERAMLPNTDPVPVWNSNEFPAKRLDKAGGSGLPYFGAVPQGMISAARGAESIWVANMYNRLYFGTQYGGKYPTTSLRHNLGSHRKVSDVRTEELFSSGYPGSFSRFCFLEECPIAATETVLISNGGSVVYVAGPATVQCSAQETRLPIPDGYYFNDNFFGFSGGAVCEVYEYVQRPGDNWNPVASGAELLNTDGFFYARVEVCGQADDGSLADVRSWDLCKKYTAGNHKPIGSLQRYGEQMRVALLDYPNIRSNTSASDPGFDRGGVLRVPMRYIGQTTFDENGANNTPQSGNPQAEWNAATGIFNPNPDGDTLGTSGVINYINQLGQRGAVPGKYPLRDRVQELYYEAVRYLQGLQPSDYALTALNDPGRVSTAKNGFPAYTAWTDPFANRSATQDYSCQKNNIFVMGDQVNDGTTTQPTTDLANNVPNLRAWREVAQRFESNTGQATYVDSQGITRPAGGNPQGDNGQMVWDNSQYGNQMIGTAYWANTQDIRGAGWTNSHFNPNTRTFSGTATEGVTTDAKRPGLRIRTHTYDVNQNGYLNSEQFRTKRSVMFMAAKYGGFERNPANSEGSPYNTWGNPFKQSDDGTLEDTGTEPTTLGIDRNLIWATTASGRAGDAKTFYRSGPNVRAVLAAFDGIFRQVASAARSIAGTAWQSQELSDSGTVLYSAKYDSTDWSGDVTAVPATEDDDGTVTLGETTWSAAARLLALADPAGSRKIFVGNEGANPGVVASAFTTAAVSETIQAHLNKKSTSSAVDNLWSARLQYLRGDRTQEASNSGVFRTRYQLLGDVVNSGVVYSGAPVADLAPTNAYQTFYNTNKTRTPAVFVGANDGMLHAFNATNGEELFAYIPSWVVPNLPALTDPTYVAQRHTSYVDATPAVADAELSSGWKTVLVSGTGHGGRGVFALDVTARGDGDFNASKVLWEFTNAHDADLGNVVGKPQILKLRTSDSDAETATYKWFAVFGSGVNNYVPDSANIFSSSGKPALFFLDLSKAAGAPWVQGGKQGANYFKVELPINSSIQATTPAGLLNFTPVLDVAGVVSKIYMGDLHGRLWKLDFATYGSSNWSLDNLSGFRATSGGSSSPMAMFVAEHIAVNGTKTVQPISAAPGVFSGSKSGTYKIVFGTGRSLEQQDAASTAVQSQYMVYDDATGATDGGSTVSAITSRQYLKQGSVDEDTGVVSVDEFTLALASTTNTSEKSGWYYDFPVTGERQVSSGTKFGTRYITSTMRPAQSGCNTADVATGNSYDVEVTSGDGTVIRSTVGSLGEPLVLNSSASTEYTDADSTKRKVKTVVSRMIYQGEKGFAPSAAAADPNCPPDSPAGSICMRVIAGRLSWRQIDNYQEMRGATW